MSVPVISVGQQASGFNPNQISSELYQQQQRLQSSILSQRSCSFRAIAVMRSMAKLPPLLRIHQALDLLYNIEMPLLISVADAEYTGFPVSLQFFSQLKQDLTDRIRIIDRHFEESGRVNPASPSEVSALKVGIIT